MSLPASWIQTELGDVLLSIVGGGTPSKSNSSYYQGNIPWMSVKDMNKNVLNDTVDHISEEAVRNSSTNIIPAGTPIVATRMSLGKIIVANFDSAINQDLKALFPASGISRDYLICWYRSIARKIEELGTGTTVKGIRLEVLNSLEFPLPPLAEQKVIADKLDTLLAQVENTKARLERIPEILKSFRQSVLAAAVSGKLTEKWRGGPLNWIKTTLDDCTFRIGDELHGTPEYSEDGEYFFVNGNNLVNGSIVIKDATKRVDKSEYEKHKRDLGENTLLLSINGTIGNLAFFRHENVVLGKSACYLNFNEKLSRNFGYILLSAQDFYQYAHDVATGATIKNVPLKGIRNYSFLVPTLDEQTEIVRRVEELFAFADRIEQAAQAAQSRVNHLTQSILAKAFRGELTADWRAANPDLISGDNSAEALLAKIKAERAKVKTRKKN